MVEGILGKLNLREDSVKLTVLGLALVGAYSVVMVTVKSTCSLMKYFVLPRKNLAARYGKGSWAVVTGASDGLGK
jgi:hypothetical protein